MIERAALTVDEAVQQRASQRPGAVHRGPGAVARRTRVRRRLVARAARAAPESETPGCRTDVDAGHLRRLPNQSGGNRSRPQAAPKFPAAPARGCRKRRRIPDPHHPLIPGPAGLSVNAAARRRTKSDKRTTQRQPTEQNHKQLHNHVHSENERRRHGELIQWLNGSIGRHAGAGRARTETRCT